MTRNGVAGPVQSLINEFSKLPTVGPKTAARLVFYLLARPRAEAQSLAEAILAVKDRVRLCSRCFSLTEDEPCWICADQRRDPSLLCVVAEAKDVFAIERTAAFRGRYHVLGGLISPMDGIGPAQLRMRELIERVGSERPSEVIVATNPTAVGEATALYVSRTLVPSGVSVTRLAYGLPIGGDLDYADEVTLTEGAGGPSNAADRCADGDRAGRVRRCSADSHADVVAIACAPGCATQRGFGRAGRDVVGRRHAAFDRRDDAQRDVPDLEAAPDVGFLRFARRRRDDEQIRAIAQRVETCAHERLDLVQPAVDEHRDGPRIEVGSVVFERDGDAAPRGQRLGRCDVAGRMEEVVLLAAQGFARARVLGRVHDQRVPPVPLEAACIDADGAERFGAQTLDRIAPDARDRPQRVALHRT